MMGLELSFIWAGIIAFAVLAYVILDGFDLGIALLFPFMRHKDQRKQAMATIAPVWDGNETWLVLGGGGLMAAFPLAYAVVMPALYPLMIAMLLGLIFRGVAFEFVPRTEKLRGLWEFGFFAGSFIATLAQGLALGTLVQGIAVENRAYAGGNWDWLTPFTCVTALSLLAGYALLGATWLVYRTEGDLQVLARRLTLPALAMMMVLMVAVSAATAWYHPEYIAKWVAFPAILYSAAVPLLALLCVGIIIQNINKDTRDMTPFLASLGLFVLSFTGLGLSFYPYIVPPSLTIAEAAAPDASLGFLLVGTVVLLPIILGYTGFAYWTFRGKVGEGDGYH